MNVLAAKGMTPADADWFIGNEAAIFDILVAGRKRTSGRRPEEFALKEACDTAYCGALEALLYFGTRLTQVGLSGLHNQCKTLVSQLAMMGQDEKEKLLIVWMPPLSLADIYRTLPRNYFPDYTNWFRDLMAKRTTHRKMEAGFRLFRSKDAMVDDSVCPSLTEVVYLQAIFHLAGQNFLYHKAIRCLHGEKNHFGDEQQRSTFRGWSDDSKDHLGFDIGKNYAFMEERKASTHFSCDRYLMTP